MNIDKILKKQKGVIIVMFLLFLPFMMAFVGLAIDFGYIYTTKTKMQNMVDAAALAGVPKLKDTKEPTKEPIVGDYVNVFLTHNGFAPLGEGEDQPLTLEHNWKMNFYRMGKPDGAVKEIPIEVTNPAEATRLRVTILKELRLLFLPIVSADFATVNLQATAVAQGTGRSVYNDEYQIIALKNLILGTKSHIPSYPVELYDTIENRYKHGYTDYGDKLKKNIYAVNLSLASGSTVRLDKKLYTQNRNINYVKEGKLVFYDDDYDKYYIQIDNNSAKAKEIEDQAKEIRVAGKKVLSTYDYDRTKAMFIDVDKYPKLLDGMGDYQFKPIVESFSSEFLNGLDIIVPVIFYSEGKHKFTIKNFNVSYYSFTEPLVIHGGSMELAGSNAPNQAPTGIGKSKRDKQFFSDIYCFADTDYGHNLPNEPDKNNYGSFSTVTGNIAPKEFSGTIYVDSHMTIKPANSYRRHTFTRTLVAIGNITFPADGSIDSANKFDSAQTSTKISLVE